MSTTVEIYLADSVQPAVLAQRVAVAIDAPGCFSPGHSFHFGLDAQAWAGFEGTGALTLAPTGDDPVDWDDHADRDHRAGWDHHADRDDAFAPYNYELSLECGPVTEARLIERLGRAVFEHLVSLHRPIALGDNRWILADHLPGRGTRDFGSGADFTAAGWDQWYDPWLYGDAAPAREPVRWPELGTGRVTVFEADGLLHFVPVYQGFGRASPRVLFPVAPVISVRASVPADELAMALAVSLDRSNEPYPAMHIDTASWITALAACPVRDYGCRAVSLDIELAGQTIRMSPRLPSADGGRGLSGIEQGPVLPFLVEHNTAPWPSRSVGARLVSLLAAVRDGSGTLPPALPPA